MPSILAHNQSNFLIRMFDNLRNAFGSTDAINLDSSSNLYKFFLGKLTESRSQVFQDLFVLFVLKEKRNGYFIEFGATNGVALSNTYLLEKSYGWKGILAEPARCWLEDLKKNRDCSMDFRCLWQETGKSLEFNETSYPELSTINEFSTRPDDLAQARTFGKKYLVETVSLDDLATSHNAPFEIDYLSIDTEGSEFSILKAFNFQKRRIKLITVEHNHVSPDRENIFSLLTSNGYKRLFELLSDCDDWYVHNSVFESTGRNEPCSCGSGRRYKHCHGTLVYQPNR
jgi:FkbM family methyltransferase